MCGLSQSRLLVNIKTLGIVGFKLTRFLSTSSGTFLLELHKARAALWEKITGAPVVCSAALIVLVDT